MTAFDFLILVLCLIGGFGSVHYHLSDAESDIRNLRLELDFVRSKITKDKREEEND